jgi:hypothetical protein
MACYCTPDLYIDPARVPELIDAFHTLNKVMFCITAILIVCLVGFLIYDWKKKKGN